VDVYLVPSLAVIRVVVLLVPSMLRLVVIHHLHSLSRLLSSGSIIFRIVIYEGLKSIAFALLILIGGVFFFFY
jgi:hypothetical protein